MRKRKYRSRGGHESRISKVVIANELFFNVSSSQDIKLNGGTSYKFIIQVL